jgi:hypothetical protein
MMKTQHMQQHLLITIFYHLPHHLEIVRLIIINARQKLMNLKSKTGNFKISLDKRQKLLTINNK